MFRQKTAFKAIAWSVTVGAFVLLAVSLSVSRTEAQVGSTPVRVVNTPLPITGTVNIGNLPAGSPGQILAPTKASDLVTLRSSRATCGYPSVMLLDRRSNTDGTLSPFTIPAGQVLIVTSVDWRQGNTGSPGKQEEFFLYPSAANIDIAPPVVDSLVPGSSDGRAGASLVVTGVAIGPGNPCWGVNNSQFLGSADAIVHGFLATDQ